MPDATRRRLLAAPLLAACLLPAGCVALDYDLSTVPAELSAKPAPPGTDTAPLRIEARNTLWLHGLFGHEQPDVAGLVSEATAAHDRVAGFRVTQTAGVHDWFITHVTATLVRPKKVVIEGQLIRD